MGSARKKRRGQAKLIASIALISLPTLAHASTKSWIGASNGGWATGANWAGAGRPQSTDFAVLSKTGGLTVLYDVTSAPFGVGSVLLEGGMTVSQSAAASQLNVGSIVIGATSAGFYTISSGALGVTNQINVGQNGTGTGVLTLNGTGLVSAATENIGMSGGGTFSQTGGTNTVTNVNIGNSGAGFYRLDGGALDATGVVSINANGTFSSNGSGSLSATTTLTLAGGVATGTITSNGTFISNSGVLNTSGAGTLLSNAGQFIYNGGDNTGWRFVNTGSMTFNADWSASALTTRSQTGISISTGRTVNLLATALDSLSNDGVINLSGGTLNANSGAATEFIGDSAVGIFVHSDGMHRVSNLNLGNTAASQGSYGLSGGTLQVSSQEIIGGGGTGTFSQSAGVHTAPRILIGNGAGAHGTFSMSGGSLTLTDPLSLFIGVNGTGAFQQTGGRVDAVAIRIAYNPASAGSYSISGGTLNTATLLVSEDDALGSFVQQNGAISVSNTLGLATFSANSRGTYTQLGGTLTATNEIIGIVGAGTFSQIAGVNSVGTLSLASQPGSTGTYALSGGTLNVSNISLGAGANFLQTGGALNVGSINVAAPVATPFNFTGGLLHLTGASLSIGSGGLLGAAVFTAPTRSIVIDQATTLSPLSLLTINGGTFSTGSFINNGGSVALNSGTLVITNSGLTIGAGQLLGQNLKLDAGAVLSLTSAANPLTVSGGAFVQINGGQVSATGGVVNQGQILFSSPMSLLSGGSITNNGLINGNGRVSAKLANQATGEVRADSGETLQFSGAANTNGGKFTLNGGRIEFTNDLTNSAGATIFGRGTLIASTGLANAGSITLSAGVSDVFGAVTNSNRINITGGSATTFWNNVNTSVGTINVNTNSTVVFAGNLIGESHVTGLGVKDFEGVASGGAIASVVGDTIVGEAAVVNADYVHEDDVQILGALSVVAGGTSASVSQINTLAIYSGKFDLANNSLVIKNTPVETIAGYIADGYHGGDWNGAGLTSTNAANASQGPHPTALGYAIASTLGISVFNDLPVAQTDVLVDYVYRGDANLDGVVNALDFNAVAANFGSGAGHVWVQGDFDYNGTTDTADFTALSSNFSQALTQSSPALPGTLVPEPMAGLAIGMLAILRRRRVVKSQ